MRIGIDDEDESINSGDGLYKGNTKGETQLLLVVIGALLRDTSSRTYTMSICKGNYYSLEE
jgi:hypothetical protein